MIRLTIRVDLSGASGEVNRVGSFGEHLRREREMRGISLDEIMATTKIGRRLLLALEEEQFDLLPGGIFNKSYVRAYAKCVGMNEDEAVAEYLEAAKEEAPDTKVIAHQHAFHSDRRPERAGFPIMPVLILVVVAIGAAGGWKAYQNHQRDRQQPANQQGAGHSAMPSRHRILVAKRQSRRRQLQHRHRRARLHPRPRIPLPLEKPMRCNRVTQASAPGANASVVPCGSVFRSDHPA